jgi:hypothetical protein
MATQSNWRFCKKCNGIFFNGYADKGVCAAGGGHISAGYTFILHHDVPETATAQSKWRFCNKCKGMFFDGYPNKGVCAASGSHQAAGYTFALPHNTPETSAAQSNWRFCNKCEGMFFDGNPGKGVCSAGGGHLSAGHVFTLPHPPYIDIAVSPLNNPNFINIKGFNFSPNGQINIDYDIYLGAGQNLTFSDRTGANSTGDFSLHTPVRIVSYERVYVKATDLINPNFAEATYTKSI